MATELESLQTRKTALLSEIEALVCTTDVDRMQAKYKELDLLNKAIQNAQGVIEEETIGYT